MTDVNETIPHLAIAISPKVPSVITGTGAVITIPTATITLTPNAPSYQKYPLIELLDENGVRIYEIEFEDVMPGQDATTREITIKNNSSGTINYSLTPTVTDEQIGKDIETVDSTFFSLDGTSWSKSLDVEVAGDSEEVIYIAYMPPSFSKIGEKEWTIVTTIEEFPFPEMEGWMVVGRFGVNGSEDGELTDHHVEYLIPYHETIMNEDFSDIRFKLGDGTDLSYYTKTIVEGESCLFAVKIPVIPESPDSIYVYVYAGNPDATSESDIDAVYIFGDDMTGVYSDKWETIAGSYQTPGYGVVDGRNTIGFNRTSGCKAKGITFGLGFMAEFECMATQYNNRLMYCQDSTPNMSTPERYCMDLDLDDRTTGLEGISKNNAMITPTSNKYGEGAWVTCILIVDADGNHSLQLGDNTPLTANDNTYTSGELAIAHYSQTAYYPGVGYFGRILISKYTPNQPTTTSFEGWTLANKLNAKGGVVIGEGNTPGINRNVRYGMLIGGNYYE